MVFDDVVASEIGDSGVRVLQSFGARRISSASVSSVERFAARLGVVIKNDVRILANAEARGLAVLTGDREMLARGLRVGLDARWNQHQILGRAKAIRRVATTLKASGRDPSYHSIGHRST